MSSAVQPYPASLSAMEIVDAKDELRRAIRAEREKRSPRVRSTAAEVLARVVGDLPQVRDAQVVAAYVSRPTEPGTVPLLERLAARGTRVLLPVLGTGLAREWAWYTTSQDLQVRAPGRPPEPPGPTLGPDALSQAEAIIAPALAVDTAGGRLGQGGGWYDRVLAHAREGTCVIATVYDEEIYDAASRPLPREEHDRTVDIVATPGGWQWVRTPDAG
ncbi:5-formyltetrahydrofolate cyclo-ligase [Actinotalea sp. K2]|uniref:5-formyltetrahydrofolate cyclo-ligase n=1 Tax=Actinotalea sp. K2 TaxID=2939438 RepID=UPI002017E915|nr:5-formyltetrahydrofolate cyclo-ligase [Actinotalea sp. K2]MCL3861255.1 5-formyltetrahydrofolate cyclo-ligase [Actinotalea sp. K2]